MTLEQLRIFIAVAEREHVTRAAEFLNMTQSSVSLAISSLEAKYKVKLFLRVGRTIRLSEEGRQFLEAARDILDKITKAEELLASFNGTLRSALSIAASQTVSNYWLPQYLHRFHLQYPDVNITLHIGNTTQVHEMLINLKADIGFVEGILDDPRLSSRSVSEDQVVVVADPATAELLGTNVSRESLKKAKWIMREKGSGTRKLLEDSLAAIGLRASDLNVELELPSNEAVRAAVEKGGVTSLSYCTVESSLQAGTLVRLPFELPNRRFFMVRLADRPNVRAADALISMIK